MTQAPDGAMAHASSPEIRRFDDPDALALAAAEEIVSCAESAIVRDRRFVMALSGGTTPALLYERLANATFASRIDWTRVHVCWGDERCVLPDDARSNFRLARERLLDLVPIPSTQIHRIAGELPAEDGARAYEATLRTLFNTPSGPPRIGDIERFDLALLGVGADGHTASLFPESNALHESARWVVAAEAPPAFATASGPWRITLTLPVINAAAQVMVLAAGADKSEVLHQVLARPHDRPALPVQWVAPTHGRLLWMVDAAAAALLDEPSATRAR